MTNTVGSGDGSAANRPYDVIRKSRVKTRVWKNTNTAWESKLVADFVRRSTGNATEAFSEWELLELAVLAKRSWRMTRNHRRRLALWNWFRNRF